MITNGTCLSYFAECLEGGIHSPDDVYMAALYTGDADVGPETKRYTTAGEVKAPGYEVGGRVLAGRKVSQTPDGAVLNFDDPVWPNSTIAACGVLVYNKTKDNRALMVGDFGEEIRSTNHEFIAHPPDDAEGWVVLRNKKAVNVVGAKKA